MRPALWLAAATAAGVGAADWLRPHPAVALVAVLACGLWFALDRSPRRSRGLLLLVMFTLGGLRYAYDRTVGRGSLEAWAGQRVELVGTVQTEPEPRKPSGSGYLLAVEQVGAVRTSGRLYVTQRGGAAPRFGERVAFSGALRVPSGPRYPGGFDRAAYLARQGAYLETETPAVERRGPGNLWWLRRAAVASRLRLESVLKQTLPAREAALMAGLLFGSRSELPSEVKEAFKTSGVFHLLAVSGGNIATILAPFLGLARRLGLGRRAAAGAAVPLVVFFVLLTGSSPSVMRAGLMAVLVLLGDLLGRERNGLNTLGAAILILLLCSPTLLFDLGFQFSALATLGILLFARRFEGWLSPRLTPAFGLRFGAWLAAGLSVTLAAQVVVEPVSLHNFGTFSIIAPVSNLLVLAFLERFVVVGMVAALVGLVALPVAWLLGWVVRVGLWLLLTTVKATSAIPGAYLEFAPLAWTWVAAWYLVLSVLVSPVARQEVRRRAWLAGRSLRGLSGGGRRAAAALTLLVLATAYTWNLALADSPDTLRLAFIDVGQGDAILVLGPGGSAMLVDAGAYVAPDPARGRAGYDAGADVILPFLKRLGVRRLEYLVLTHPDQDHAGGGLSVLQSMPVGALLVSKHESSEKRHAEAVAEARMRRIPIHAPVAGARLDLGGGAAAEVLNPPAEQFRNTRSDDNSNCIALRVTYRRVAILLTCDLEAVSEAHLLQAGANLKADVLKVSHHGSAHSSTPPFLMEVRPSWAVISAGNGNSYGHPHKATLERLEETGARILRTDRHGTIQLRTDGFLITLETTRGKAEDGEYQPLALLRRRLWNSW